MAQADNQLTDREKGLVRRLVGRYGDQSNRALRRSQLIFTAMVAAGFALSTIPLASWLGIGDCYASKWLMFPVVLIPALWMFSRYRRFAIFKSRIMRKLAIEAGIVGGSNESENEEGPRGHPRGVPKS